MEFVLGVDGGGTRTRMWLAQSTGNVLARVEGGPSNWQEQGHAGVAELLVELRDRALRAASLDPAPPKAVHVGLAGVATAAERGEVGAALETAGLAPGAALTVSSDLVPAHAGALLGAAGIVVIAGTGSVAFGRGSSGNEARAGGCGPLLGDEGSAYDLGRRALISVVRAADGRGPATALGPALLGALGLGDLRALLGEAARGGLGRGRIAALAPHVTHLAEQGDAAAERCIEGAVSALAECVHAVVESLGERELPIAALGGLVSNSQAFAAALRAALAEAVPQLSWQGPKAQAVAGAVLLALTRAADSPSSRPGF